MDYTIIEGLNGISIQPLLNRFCTDTSPCLAAMSGFWMKRILCRLYKKIVK